MKLKLALLALIAMLVAVWCWNRASPEPREVGFVAPVEAAEVNPRSATLEIPAEKLVSATEVVAEGSAPKRVTVASPFASIEVTVLGEDGTPLAGLTVVAAPRLDEATRAKGSYKSEEIRFAQTSSGGKAAISGLPPREYEVSCQAASTTATVRQRIVLAADERRTLELRFRAEGDRPPCIAGVIVDEQGLPIEGVRVRLLVDKAASLSAWSDKDGRFAQTFPEGREIAVTVGGGPKDDDYEPSSLVVPFGTQSVRIRREKTIPEIKVELICLDETTGERVQPEEWIVSGFRGSSPEEKLDLSSVGGVFTVKDRPDWHISFFHPRLGVATGSFSDGLTRGPAGNTLTVRVRKPMRVTKDGFLIQDR